MDKINKQGGVKMGFKQLRKLELTGAELYKVIHFLGLVKPLEEHLEVERKQCMKIMTRAGSSKAVNK